MFHTNLPVVDDEFCDRRDELARLSAAVDALRAGSPRWLALLGRRKVGKTSLLLEAARRNAGRAPRFVVLDVLEQSPISPEFFRIYALRAADALLAPSAGASVERAALDPPRYQRTLLASDLFRGLDAALQGDLLSLPALDLDAAGVRLCADLPERLAEGLDTRVLVAVDEFQALGEMAKGRGGLDPFPLLRSRWQRHRRVGYVVSGSSRTMMEALVSDRHAPFFQHFDVCEIGVFPRDEAVALFRAGGEVSEALAERAARLVGDHPFYLQLLGEALVRGPEPYDEHALKVAFQDLLFSRTGRLALYFQRYFDQIVGRSTYLAAALTALAESPRRPGELAKAIKAGTADTSRYVERLGDAVRRTDGVLSVDDPLFAMWLRWRGPAGAVVPMSVLGDAAERRAAEHLAALGFDLVYQSRASRGAFDLLAIRGGGQLGVQVKRTARLPLRFSPAAWARM